MKGKQKENEKSRKATQEESKQNSRGGLSLKEKLRLIELKKQLSEKKSTIPHTAQETIPIVDMTEDGICDCGDNYYTKMIEFYDMNYCLLDDEARKDVLALYSNLINYFNPNVYVQLFMFNRRVNEEILRQKFEIELRGDEHDDIRTEYSEMLKKQAAEGKNGVIKSKALIFGLKADSIEDARRKLGSIEKDILRYLRNMGTTGKCLDGYERLKILHDYFDQYSMNDFKFSYKHMQTAGKTVKDYIAPPGFDFRYPSRFRSGRMFGRTSVVNILASKFTEEIIQSLLDIDDNLTLSIHIRLRGMADANKYVSEKLSSLQADKIDMQKNAVRSGFDMDILPPNMMTLEKGGIESLEDLNEKNQKLIHMAFAITCFGRTKHELDALEDRVKGIIQSASCELVNMMYRQEEGVISCAPLGLNVTGTDRDMNTRSTAILIPFNTQELFMGGEALYYGLNTQSNNMILADRKKLRTPNGVILGTPGSGKSFSAKREMLGVFLTTRDDIIVCDPEGEYFPIIHALGGETIKLATNSKDYLNPMDIQISHKNDREALKLKSDFIITLCDLIAGGKDGLQNDEKGIIDECIRNIYKDYFENPVPENMPVLEDLYNALIKYEPVNVIPELQLDAKRKAVNIANNLVIFVKGSQNYFNHRTNVDSQNRVICFDIRDLSSQLKEIGMLVVQDAVWNRVSANREKRIATRYYCDEFHLLLRDKQTAKYCVEIWKRFRKWGGIPTGMTQNVSDFLRSPEIEGILGNSDFVYLLNQNAPDREILRDKLALSQNQLEHVTGSEPGRGLIIFDSVVIPFADPFPLDTKMYRIMTTKPEEAIQIGDVSDG